MQIQTRFQSSALGDWRITTATPPAGMDDAVTVFWDVEGLTHYASETILPTGHVDVLINLASRQYLVDADDPSRRTCFATAWVSGMQQQPLQAQSEGYSHLVGLRLTPLGAWRFFGLPLIEITGRVLDIDLILGRSLLALREQFAAHHDPEWRLRRFAEFVRRRLLAGPPVHCAVRQAMARLRESGGLSSVGMLVAETGFSQKHLIRKFHEQVGLGPKRFAQLLKFRRAVRRLQSGAAVELGLVALDAGYYDQAHFNLDFRRFAGVTPSEFLRRRLPDDVTASMSSG